MGWPFSGSWGGRNANDIAEIAAAICTGINEREDLAGVSQTTWINGTVAAEPSKSDLAGIPRTGTNSLDDLIGEIMTALFGTTDLTAVAITGNVTCGNATNWIRYSTDTQASYTLWTIDAIISDAGTLTKDGGRYPKWEYPTQLEWWNTLREVLDRLIYRIYGISNSFNDDATTSTCIYVAGDLEQARRNAWSSRGSTTRDIPAQLGRAVYASVASDFCGGIDRAIAEQCLTCEVSYDTTTVAGTPQGAVISGVALPTPSYWTPTYEFDGVGFTGSGNWFTLTLGSHTVDLTMSDQASYPRVDGSGDAQDMAATDLTAYVGILSYVTTDLSNELADQS